MASRSICCVLKSGGDFKPEHVFWLREQCRQHMPDWDFKIWSDRIPESRPLYRRWPKWWSKFEIYQYKDIGPALVVDLDTVFLSGLKILPEHEDKAIMLRDVWKDGARFPERLGGGFSYLPVWAQDKLWSEWIRRGPENVMAQYGGDDQPFLHELFSKEALRWQDEYVDEVVSYKVHIKGIGLQEDNKVVFFHGKPRPWDVDEPWIPEVKSCLQN